MKKINCDDSLSFQILHFKLDFQVFSMTTIFREFTDNQNKQFSGIQTSIDTFKIFRVDQNSIKRFKGIRLKMLISKFYTRTARKYRFLIYLQVKSYLK